MYTYPQQQQQHVGVDADPLSNFLQIAQSKIQAATSTCTWGHGMPSLYKISTQDLLKILGITNIGCIAAYLIAKILLNHVKEKEDEKSIIMHQ
jgi:hypothetical protein